MDQTEEELQQIRTWFKEQGLSPDASTDTQLCFLWRTLQLNKNNLNSLTKTLDVQRSQYATEILEVRKSLEQIRVFTGHKDVLAQEIQNENDQLRDQLRRLLSLQNAQFSEVAKMLYNQGLTELIHSSPSEQVAYLLVERASLLETESLNPAASTSDSSGTEVHPYTASAGQTSHKRALRHNQSPWKRLFGFHKTQTKYQFFPGEARHLADQASSVQRECFRLERDLEEGSRRLAMAHNEIRRLTDELESSQLIQRAYEPELEAAKQEVEHLRQEVEQLKKYEMMGLRKAREMINFLDLENQRLRSKLMSVDAEKTPLPETSATVANTIVPTKQLPTELVQTDPTSEHEKELEKLRSALQQQQTRAEEERQINKRLEAEVIQTKEICQNLQNELSINRKQLSEKGLEIEALKLELEKCRNQSKPQILLDNFVDCQQPQPSETNLHSVHEERAEFLSDHKEDCESLSREICDVLKSLNQERWKYQEMKEKLQTKLCRAKQRMEEETKWRDERIDDLQRDLSLCLHSLTKEKELVINVTMENDKLLVEKRRLLQQITDEAYNKKELKNTCDFLKTRNFLPAQTSSLVSSSQCSSLARSAEMGYLNLNSHPPPLLNTTDP